MIIFKNILLFAIFSFILCDSSVESNGGLIEISREYEINNNLNTAIVLEGFISFQACDAQACIPIFQNISHIVVRDQIYPNVKYPIKYHAPSN